MSTAFGNGVEKAVQEITNKASSAGVEFMNDAAYDEKMKAKGYRYKVQLPSGMGEDLYARDFNAAKEMAKGYGKGTLVTELK